MGYRLIVHNKEDPEGDSPKTLEFDQDLITLGRHSSNDFQIAHPGASRQHCKILLEDGNYFLLDPGSANGTLLNGRKIPLKRNQLLKDNDLISVESYDIRFKSMDRVAVKGPGENTDEVALRVVREVLGSLQSQTNPYIEIIGGPNKGKLVELNKDVQQIIIGRSETSDLVLNDPMMSRRNTKIRRDWSGISIFDMNSKNGTYVNGEKIKEVQLKEGDKIRIGESEMVFRNPKEAFHREIEAEMAPKKSSGKKNHPSTIERNIDEVLIDPGTPAPEKPNSLVDPEAVGLESSAQFNSLAHSAGQPSAPVPEHPTHQENLDMEEEVLWKTFSTIDFIIIIGGIVVIIVCFVIIFKFLFN